MEQEKIDILTELGEFTGQTATLDECHSKGYWHRAVFCLIINKEGKILLQKRSPEKKLWPNKWDLTVGGHVRTGEFGRQALIRECKEELGLNIKDDEIKFLVSSISKYNKNGYINNHFDECYLIIKDVNINEITMQKSEVSEVAFFTQEDLSERIKDNYKDLTEKTISWPFIRRIIESNIINELIKNNCTLQK